MKTVTLPTEALRGAKIPSRFWKLGVDTYRGDRRALDQIQHFVTRFDAALKNGTGLLLFGPPNTFKTFLATYVLKHLLAKDLDVQYFTLFSLMEAFDKHLLAVLLGPDYHCVVFDNIVPPEGETWLARRVLVNAVVRRSDAGLPYIVCSVIHDWNVWQATYGEEIKTRLQNDLIEVDCSGPHIGHYAAALSDERKLKVTHTKKGKAYVG